jgi:hypothetical protein
MRSIDGWGVLFPQAAYQQEGGAITPHPDLRSDLPLKGGGAGKDWRTSHQMTVAPPSTANI